jgi:dolichol-phosphate mannosyltransferase
VSAPRLSVVIPFFQEQENVAPLFAELLPILAGLPGGYEVVAVDDGSTDGTLAALRAVQTQDDNLRVLVLDRNRGQTAAFEAGFLAARGRLIATMDGDLQIDPRDLPVMVAQLEREGADFVYGWRRDRKDPFLKRVSTRVANAIRNLLTHERIHDTGCPLKVFRRSVIERMKLFSGMHRFFITLAHMDGWRSSEMVVRHRPRRFGRSKYGVRNRVFRALRDCLVVRWMMSRHLRYEVRELPAVAARPVEQSESHGA